MTDRAPRPVDELREQLKALGYLDARVDRFVLGRSRGAERPVRFALAASARIGIIAGLLLGPAAALGLRLRAPEVVVGPTDALVLSLYLAALFGVAAAIVAIAGIAAGAALARAAAERLDFAIRARRVAAFIGASVGIACLAYLTLWWRATSALGAAEPVGWSIAALATAAAIALLLGHAVGATILAVVAHFGLARSLAPGLPLSSPRVTLPLGLIGAGGALALLLASGPVETDTGSAPPLTVVPTGLRVVAIAIDGVDVATLDRLRDAGQLPAFDRLLSGSVARLAADPDRDPARVWTTIATGQPPERHGIRGLESRQIAGLEGRLRSSRFEAITAATDLLRLTRPAIASSHERLIPAFWEVAARAGLRTAAIHWWATWPAPEGLGIVLSDRAILRLERGGALDREIAPPDLYTTLAEAWPARRERAQAAAAHLDGAGEAGDAVSGVIRRSAELDATIADVALDPALGDLDVLTLYLPGLDIAQHALLTAGTGGTLAASEVAARVASIERYYRFLDATLAAVHARMPRDAVALLITQPGRIATPSAGLLAAIGPPARRAGTNASPASVAPTVLYALGVPIAADLASGPALDLFAPGFVSDHPPRAVATYGTREPLRRTAGAQTLDDEMIERLRSLGYVR